MSWGRKASYRSYRAENARRRERNVRKRERRAARIRAGLPVEAERVSIWPYLLAGLLMFGLLMGVSHCYGAEPDQAKRWQSAKIDERRSIALDKAVSLYQRNAARYQAVSAKSGVPAVVIFGLHLRESDCSFSDSLAQGDPLTHRSRNVPANRIPGTNPPYTWEQCAMDGLSLDHMGAYRWNDTQSALMGITKWNGLGPENHGVASGYTWAATNQYGTAPNIGKYISDGRWDSHAVDSQLGVAAVLLRMRERGIPLPF